VLIAPIIPGITDDTPGLSALLAAAHAMGAAYAVGNALRLGPAARRRFLPYLDHEFPLLAGRYRRHYATADHASPAYQRALAARLARLQRLHGFDVDAGMREAQEWRDGTGGPGEQPGLF
jgi:DNA repair photolyase